MRLPRTPIIIAVVAVILIAALYMIPAYDWTDGAPEASIHIDITKSDGTLYTGTVEIADKSIIDSLTTYPLTTYTADSPPVEPYQEYTIRITTTVITTSAKVGEGITTTVNVQAHNNRTMQVMNTEYVQVNYTCGNSYQDIRTSSTVGQSTSGAAVVIPSALFVGASSRFDSPNWHEIQGQHIDGATFLVNIDSRSAGGGYGLSSAVLNVVVGAGGDLSVVISDITTSVNEG